MKDIFIADDFKKESKRWRTIMIFTYSLSILFPIAVKISKKGNDITKIDIVLSFIFFFFLGSFSLYAFLYSRYYKLLIYEESIKIKTLFKEVDISINTIDKYEYKRYKRSIFYKYTLFCGDKKYFFYTRHLDEVDNFLNKKL